MFFKKKSSKKADLKADDDKKRTYFFGGDEKKDELPKEDDIEKSSMLEDQAAGKTPFMDKQAAEIENESENLTNNFIKLENESELSTESNENKELSPPPPPLIEPAATEDKIKETVVQPPALPEAVRDLQEAQLDEEEYEIIRNKKTEKSISRKNVEGLATIARLRWWFLLMISLFLILTWSIEANLSDRIYRWNSLILLGITLFFTCLSSKFLRLPTRAGLAALGLSASFYMTAIYGPPSELLWSIPHELYWSVVLLLTMIWVGVGIWRKIGRYKIIDIILSAVLIYAALSPIFYLISYFLANDPTSQDLLAKTVSKAPSFITAILPWYLWPMTMAIALILPLAVFLSLWDQISSLKRRGARHGGNIFLAFAFLCLIPYGFLTFQPAVEELPDLAEKARYPNVLLGIENDKGNIQKVKTSPPPARDGASVLEEKKQDKAIAEHQKVDEKELSPRGELLRHKALDSPESRSESEFIASSPQSEDPTKVLPKDLEENLAVPSIQPQVTEEKIEDEPLILIRELEKEKQIEERLKAAEKSLNEALKRISELEKQIQNFENSKENAIDVQPTLDDIFQLEKPKNSEMDTFGSINEEPSESKFRPKSSNLYSPLVLSI